MPESNNVFKQSLKHKGFFNFSDLYTFCFNWLKEEGYNVSEDKYVEKISSHGKELIIVWKSKKKVTDYFAYEIKLKWHILGLKDTEVEIDGKKQETNKGDLELKFEANLIRDYEKRWETSAFYKFLRGIYDKYIVRTTIDEYEDRLQSTAEGFVEDVKAFLALEGKK